MRSEKIEFTGATGHKLAARLDLPDNEVRAYALFAHCFTCNKDIFAASRIAQGLADRQIAVLRFDFTGLGHSDGEFENTNFSSNVADLLAAVDWMRENHEAPSIVIGHSLGGSAVLAAASQIEEAKAIATIGSPSTPENVSKNFDEFIEKIKTDGEAEVSLGGRPFVIKKQFLEDISGHNLTSNISEMKKALLVFHAPMDQQVSVDHASKIFMAAKHPKSFVSLDDADHLLTRKEDAAYVAEVISSWATRYLGENLITKKKPALKSQNDEVVVAENGDGPFGQNISIRGHHVLRADEPVDMGGQERGPAPYDFVMAGLGACTSMTMRMYADLKKLPLDNVKVTLKHSKVDAAELSDFKTEQKKVDVFEREIEINGDLEENTRQKLLEIANKCPVHRTLHSDIHISTRLKE